MKNLLLVFAGGGLGSTLRYGISVGLNKVVTSGFPLATFLVNITGCLLIGLFIGYGQKHWVQTNMWHVFLVTGICGGYTTFSAFSLENVRLLQNGEMLMAFLYIGGSLVLGILATVLGLILTKG